MQRAGFELGTSRLPDWRPSRHGHGESTICMEIIDEVIQLLLHSKVAKAKSYFIGGYHDEWIELTYYIETLVTTVIIAIGVITNLEFYCEIINNGP